MKVTAYSRSTQINIFISDQLITRVLAWALPYVEHHKLQEPHFLRQLLPISMAFISRIMYRNLPTTGSTGVNDVVLLPLMHRSSYLITPSADRPIVLQ